MRLDEVVADARAEVEDLLAEHTLLVDAEPLIVTGDRDDLQRVVRNLLENAARHTPPGTTVSATVARRGATVCLAVEDDGPGLAPSVRGRAFERFVRAGSRQGPSSGLGSRSCEPPPGAWRLGGAALAARADAACAWRCGCPNRPAALANAYTSTTTGSSIGAPLQALIHHARKVVVEELLQAIGIVDALRGGALERVIHGVAEGLDELLSSSAGTPRRSTSGSATERLDCSSTVANDHADPIRREHAAIAQGHIGHIADLHAVHEEHAGTLGLATACTLCIDLDHVAVVAAEDVLLRHADGLRQSGVELLTGVVAVERHHVARGAPG